MKRLVLVVAVLFATTAFAAATAPKDAKILTAKQGNVTFKHDTHAKVACAKCHGPGEAKAIGKMEKEKAHALCQGCHKAEAKGPQKCAECHKK
jgi:predicted CXXCH cytochrome family protein